jgi:hypothetical protein
MPRRGFPAACLVALPLLLAGAPRTCAEEVSPASQQGEFFEKSVRPLLVANCQECHSAQKQQGGLRLDSRAAVLAGGDSGPAIVPGKPEESLLIKAVHYDDANRQMPPKGQLRSEDVVALTTWVKLGAPWPVRKDEGGRMKDEAQVAASSASSFILQPSALQHWSFQPVANPPLPGVHNGAWPKQTLDHFVLHKLEAATLKPSVPAEKRTLIRRATFDLIGLPPSPEEIEAFVADDSDDAFARVVDRLLSSPHYGERWARHWLDVARYGEDQAHTFQARKYPEGFRYRDWLVRSFNEDLPYDEFVRQQIAADLLGDPEDKQRLAALGFFALGPVYYGDSKKLDQMDDRIDTLSRGFLGLTVACARCHDHKFDPISTKDYYALAGVIASTEYVEVPLVSQEEVEAAEKALSEEDKKKKVRPKYPLIHAVKDAEAPVTMRVHIRGSADNLGVEAPRRFLTLLERDETPFEQGSGRLELADEIASKDNPLTARVMVNRVWKHHFGKGLVRTPSNFGMLGEPPTHPDLLDHLTTQFIESGWSLKWLHRTMMLSAAYQQASGSDERGMEVDPENRLLWRMNRRRLEVEAWRDAMLAVSGALDPSLGGPSQELAEAGNRRRTFYGFVSRHELNPLLRLFDFPDPNITSDERPVTTVPLQQLFVLNSEFMVRNSKALAARIQGEPREEPASYADELARVRRAYVVLYGREAKELEVERAVAFVMAGEPASSTKAENKLTRWEQLAQVLLSANEFMFVD